MQSRRPLRSLSAYRERFAVPASDGEVQPHATASYYSFHPGTCREDEQTREMLYWPW